jgi:hypothetical protein
MNEDSQIVVPDSFIDLYRSPGRVKLSAPRSEIAGRYEFCEDLASLLTEHARAMQFDLGIDEPAVLERCHLGLMSPDSGVTLPEAGWVVRRLAELLGWPDPGAHSAAPAA